jgi:hypothetical protein
MTGGDEYDRGNWYKGDVGPDGYPLDPEHPFNKMTAADWNARFIARELDAFERAFKAGADAALTDVVRFCGPRELPLPRWAWEALLNRPAGKRRPGPRAKLEVHWLRWNVVECLRHPFHSEIKPLTKEAAFDRAADELRGTIAEAERSTIEESYDFVRGEIKNGTYARFYFGRPSTK